MKVVKLDASLRKNSRGRKIKEKTREEKNKNMRTKSLVTTKLKIQ